MGSPGFDFSAIAAYVADTGVGVTADNYNRNALWYRDIVETVDIANTSHPYLGDKSTTIVGGATPLERKDGAPIQSSVMGQGYTPQGAIKGYARQFSIPERQILAAGGNPKNAFGSALEQFMADFARQAVISKNRRVAKMLVNGGKTAGDVAIYDGSFIGNADTNAGKGYDGVCWFSASHPLAQLTGTTKSNTLGASGITLNTTNLDAGIIRQTVTNAVDEANQPIMLDSAVLVVPRALRSTAIALLDSPQLPGSPNNDVNAWSSSKTGINWVDTQFLDAESTTAWFLFTAMKGLRELDGGAPVFRSWYDEATRSVVVSGEFHDGFYLRDFRSVVAANVATS